MWLPACICVNKDGSKFVLVHSFHAFLRENNGVFRVGLGLVVIFFVLAVKSSFVASTHLFVHT